MKKKKQGKSGLRRKPNLTAIELNARSPLADGHEVVLNPGKFRKTSHNSNLDTISLNCEQFSGRAPFFPGPAIWEKPFNPRSALNENETEQELKDEFSRRKKKRNRKK